MSGVQLLQVQSDQDGMRLDRWFKSLFPQLGHGQLEKLLRKGQIRVDGGRVKANSRLATGQTVRVPPLPDRKPRDDRRNSLQGVPDELKQQIRDSVIYQDDDVLVLNKPSGLAVQGGSKTSFHVDGLLDLLTFGADERPRLVHRLDRDTSGALVIGRNRRAAHFLTKAFAARDARKIYWGLTQGVPRPEQGDINLKLIKRAAADGAERVRPAEKGEQGGLKAVTRFSVISRAGQDFAWVAFMPLTGRTHQIRAHALAIGHPLVGDGKYYDPELVTGGELARKLHLHAYSIDLPHPAGGRFSATAALSGHMAESWSFLGFEPESFEDPFPEDI